MKRVIIIGFYLLITCVGLVAAPMDTELNKGDKLTLNLELVFSNNAKEEGAFISWELVGDWDKFDYSFSQGVLEDNIFTVKAADYKEFMSGESGIAVVIAGKPKIEDAAYSLLMKVIDVSESLDFPKDELDLNMNIHYILPPPPPVYQRLILPVTILVVLSLIIWLVFSITARFPNGSLQLGRDEVNLKGKSRVSVKDELEKLGVVLDDCDVVFIKKRFVSFQGPCIKELHNCTLERDGIYVSKGTVLLPEEELRGLTDNNGNEIIIRYF